MVIVTKNRRTCPWQLRGCVYVVQRFSVRYLFLFGPARWTAGCYGEPTWSVGREVVRTSITLVDYWGVGIVHVPRRGISRRHTAASRCCARGARAPVGVLLRRSRNHRTWRGGFGCESMQRRALRDGEHVANAGPTGTNPLCSYGFQKGGRLRCRAVCSRSRLLPSGQSWRSTFLRGTASHSIVGVSFDGAAPSALGLAPTCASRGKGIVPGRMCGLKC